jgi:hypothetical protein
MPFVSDEKGRSPCGIVVGHFVAKWETKLSKWEGIAIAQTVTKTDFVADNRAQDPQRCLLPGPSWPAEQQTCLQDAITVPGAAGRLTCERNH